MKSLQLLRQLVKSTHSASKHGSTSLKTGRWSIPSRGMGWSSTSHLKMTASRSNSGIWTLKRTCKKSSKMERKNGGAKTYCTTSSSLPISTCSTSTSTRCQAQAVMWLKKHVVTWCSPTIGARQGNLVCRRAKIPCGPLSKTPTKTKMESGTILPVISNPSLSLSRSRRKETRIRAITDMILRCG